MSVLGKPDLASLVRAKSRDFRAYPKHSLSHHSSDSSQLEPGLGVRPEVLKGNKHCRRPSDVRFGIGTGVWFVKSFLNNQPKMWNSNRMMMSYNFVADS